MKLDAKFEGEIRKVKDGSIVPDDEWIVFLAKDNAFAAMFCDPDTGYQARCADFGADYEQMSAVSRMEQRLKEYRRNNPDRLKIPDAKGEKLLDAEAKP